MARKHTEEELAEFRVMIIDYMGKFYRNNGRLPKNSEISKSKCGFSYNTMHKVFGGKRNLEVEMGLREPKPEPETFSIRETPFRQETYAKQQGEETLAMVPGIDLSQYAHCTRIGDRHGQL